MISQENREWLTYVIKRDVKFLCDLHLMDYSLLIIIVDQDKVSQQVNGKGLTDYLNTLKQKKYQFQSEDASNYVYHIAIIDYL